MSNTTTRRPPEWKEVRAKFRLTPGLTEFAAMVTASNPEAVAAAIDTYRAGINASPYQYPKAVFTEKPDAVFQAVEDYFNVSRRLVAYTHSTTVALAQIYGGVRIAPGDEILTSRNEHFTTLEALRLRALRDGTRFRQVPLYASSANVSEAEILGQLETEIRPWTRVLALTWVYSSDGVKLPVAAIAALVRSENRRRGSGQDRLLLAIDGVHGFGVEDTTFPQLGCDFFAAGCHKWVFGPRGSALLCATTPAWRQLVPLVPSFYDGSTGLGQAHTPGGLLAFEHFWALPEAFAFLRWIQKPRIQEYVHRLCTRLKKQLLDNDRVELFTPLSADYSSGIVAFDIRGLPANTVVTELLKKKFSATMSSFDPTAGRAHVRLSPCVYNTEDDVDRVARAVYQISRT